MPQRPPCNSRADDDAQGIRVTMVMRQRLTSTKPSDRSSAVLSKLANLRTTHCLSRRANTRDGDVKQADRPPLQTPHPPAPAVKLCQCPNS